MDLGLGMTCKTFIRKPRGQKVPLAMKPKVQGKKVETDGEGSVQAKSFSKAQETVKRKAVLPHPLPHTCPGQGKTTATISLMYDKVSQPNSKRKH